MKKVKEYLLENFMKRVLMRKTNNKKENDINEHQSKGESTYSHKID